ncbi:MAG: elongation factor Ts [Candidatus Pacebacteria bacterium]|nr:elongation factor Ts [Candidatus Paceibacterota bacterium]
MAITTEQIKELRDATGVSVMQCKKALEEVEGDMEKAMIALQKQSKQAASKKADRNLGSGTIASYIHAGGSVGTLVELACETDFVAKNEEFQKLAYDIAMHVAATAPEYLKKEDVTEEAQEKVKEVFAKDVEGKPDNLKEQILKGKLEAYFDEKVLLNQSYIKDPEKTINDLIEAGVQKFGERIELVRFVRFAIE